MKIEKWKYEDQEIDVPIIDADEEETNQDLEDTLDLTQVIEVLGDKNE